MTESELIGYFNEHVLYELLMLRYSKQHLESCKDRLFWNAMFATFNVSARNIYDFFSSDDNRCVGLRDFEGHYGGFKCHGRDNVSGTLDKVNAQCLHLGKRRTRESAKKVNLERVRAIFGWAESNLLSLIGSVDFKDQLDLAKAEPAKQAVLLLALTPGSPASATNVVSTITTSFVLGTSKRPKDA